MSLSDPSSSSPFSTSRCRENLSDDSLSDSLFRNLLAGDETSCSSFSDSSPPSSLPSSPLPASHQPLPSAEASSTQHPTMAIKLPPPRISIPTSPPSSPKPSSGWTGFLKRGGGSSSHATSPSGSGWSSGSPLSTGGGAKMMGGVVSESAVAGRRGEGASKDRAEKVTKKRPSMGGRSSTWTGDGSSSSSRTPSVVTSGRSSSSILRNLPSTDLPFTASSDPTASSGSPRIHPLLLSSSNFLQPPSLPSSASSPKGIRFGLFRRASLSPRFEKVAGGSFFSSLATVDDRPSHSKKEGKEKKSASVKRQLSQKRASMSVASDYSPPAGNARSSKDSCPTSPLLPPSRPSSTSLSPLASPKFSFLARPSSPLAGRSGLPTIKSPRKSISQRHIPDPAPHHHIPDTRDETETPLASQTYFSVHPSSSTRSVTPGSSHHPSTSHASSSQHRSSFAPSSPASSEEDFPLRPHPSFPPLAPELFPKSFEDEIVEPSTSFSLPPELEIVQAKGGSGGKRDKGDRSSSPLRRSSLAGIVPNTAPVSPSSPKSSSWWRPRPSSPSPTTPTFLNPFSSTPDEVPRRDSISKPRSRLNSLLGNSTPSTIRGHSKGRSEGSSSTGSTADPASKREPITQRGFQVVNRPSTDLARPSTSTITSTPTPVAATLNLPPPSPSSLYQSLSLSPSQGRASLGRSSSLLTSSRPSPSPTRPSLSPSSPSASAIRFHSSFTTQTLGTPSIASSRVERARSWMPPNRPAPPPPIDTSPYMPASDGLVPPIPPFVRAFKYSNASSSAASMYDTAPESSSSSPVPVSSALPLPKPPIQSYYASSSSSSFLSTSSSPSRPPTTLPTTTPSFVQSQNHPSTDDATSPTFSQSSHGDRDPDASSISSTMLVTPLEQTNAGLCSLGAATNVAPLSAGSSVAGHGSVYDSGPVGSRNGGIRGRTVREGGIGAGRHESGWEEGSMMSDPEGRRKGWM